MFVIWKCRNCPNFSVSSNSSCDKIFVFSGATNLIKGGARRAVPINPIHISCAEKKKDLLICSWKRFLRVSGFALQMGFID